MYNKKDKGFTLIEILIAMSIISLIAMTFFTFLNSSIKFNTKNEKDIKTLNIAQSEIENLREQIKLGKKTKFKTSDNRNLNLNETTPVYKMYLAGDKHSYDVDINLSCIDDLYTIKINVKLSDEYFSKKTTYLITEVFGG